MPALALRFPEDKHMRLKQFAAAVRWVRVDKLMHELARIALANFDVRSRFAARAEPSRAAPRRAGQGRAKQSSARAKFAETVRSGRTVVSISHCLDS